MGVWGMVSHRFLEDDGKAYSTTDTEIRQHVSVNAKKEERSKSFPRTFRKLLIAK